MFTLLGTVMMLVMCYVNVFILRCMEKYITNILNFEMFLYLYCFDFNFDKDNQTYNIASAEFGSCVQEVSIENKSFSQQL